MYRESMSQTDDLTAQPSANAAPVTVEVPGALIAAARDLLARTAELPATRRELFTVLSEYRAAVYALAIRPDRA